MTPYDEEFEEVKTDMKQAIVELTTPIECPMINFQSKKTDELNAALAKAQGEFPVIENDDSIQFMKSKYASINTIIKAVQSPLKGAGLSISHHAIRENGEACLLTVLRHSSGQWTTNRARIVPEKNDFLTYSSLVGKLKRIAFMNLLNITTQDQE